MIPEEYKALEAAIEDLAKAETKTRGKACLNSIHQAIEHINEACKGWYAKKEREG